MPIVPLGGLLRDALEKQYALPALNIWTYQDALSYVQAAEEARSPLVLQTSGTCIQHNGLDLSFRMAMNAARDTTAPVAIHLDHCEDPRMIFDAVHMGYTSVMYDGSKLPLEENIRLSRLVADVAREYGVSVEAEIGHVGKGAGDQEILTAPEDALRFLEATGVDALAVAVGTRHGMQRRDAALRFDVLEELSRRVKAPLVLHGSSGVDDNDLPRVAASGVCKVNIATRLRRVFIEAAGELAPGFHSGDHIEFIMAAHQHTTREAIHLMRLLGSAGKS